MWVLLCYFEDVVLFVGVLVGVVVEFVWYGVVLGDV